MSGGIRIGQRGEYRAVRHTGHTYDPEGNIVKHGVILQETDWVRNKFTKYGFQRLLAEAGTNIKLVAGGGTTEPTEDDTQLESYYGTASTMQFVSRTVSATPVNGLVKIVCIWRGTFNPGSLGIGPVTINEGGMATSSSPNGQTPLFSRGLLVDGMGTPVSMQLDASSEYMDLYWKWTQYFPASAVGNVDLTVMGTNTSHEVSFLPHQLDNTGFWGNQVVNAVQGFGGINNYNHRAYDGNATTNLSNGWPDGSYTVLSASYFTLDTYVLNSKERTFKYYITPADGNLANDIRTLILYWSCCAWQIQFEPKLQKLDTPARVIRLDFKLSMDNQ